MAPPALALDPGLKWVWKTPISSCLDGAANYLYILNANSKDTGRKFFFSGVWERTVGEGIGWEDLSACSTLRKRKQPRARPHSAG